MMDDQAAISTIVPAMPEAIAAAEGGADIHRFRGQRRRRFFAAMYSGVGQKIIGFIVSVLSVSLTVRFLDQERYGMWAVITSFVAFLSLGNFGLGNGLVTRLSATTARGDERGTVSAFSSTFAIVLLVTAALLIALGIAGFTVPWARLLKVSSPLAVREAAPTVMITIGSVLAVLPLGLGTSALLAHQRGDLVSLISAAGLLTGLGLLYGAIKLHASLPVLAAVLMFPQVLSAAATFLVARRLKLAPLQWDAVSVRVAWEMLRLGGRFFVLQLYAIAVFETGELIITRQFGAARVPAYDFANRVVLMVVTAVTIIVGPLWAAYGEAYARGDLAWVRNAFRKSILAILAIWMPAAVFLGFGGGSLVIQLWGGKANVPGPGLMWAMIGFGFIWSLGMAVSTLLNGVGRLTSQLIGGGLMMLAHIPLAIYLCRHFGIGGVGMSQALVMALISLPATLIEAVIILRNGDRLRLKKQAGSAAR